MSCIQSAYTLVCNPLAQIVYNHSLDTMVAPTCFCCIPKEVIRKKKPSPFGEGVGAADGRGQKAFSFWRRGTACGGRGQNGFPILRLIRFFANKIY